ncbi:MAG: hypothetical protein IPK17_08455 [Chloroflexi bacterium]|uniref:hypothetical protein n=1 Tax=Candidatus Flexifilum breve TaxID=3140694 RepID=UPI003135EE04|nr:hypothetical protein [Chloroflexota bacterium]
MLRSLRDGGRDGIGQYRIGVEGEGICIDFAVAKKCYGEGNSVGVRETVEINLTPASSTVWGIGYNVLCSTTSISGDQEDQHPIIVIAGRDIVQLLMSNGLGEIPMI